MRILIADDDDLVRRLVGSLLRRRGFTVVEARDGSEAWDVLCAEDPPRLAVLDWLMPGVDGVELCRRIRERENLRLMYVLILTARTNKENVLEALRAGANDYLTKPFDVEELEARIRLSSMFVGLQDQLAARVRELEQALAQVKRLRGPLPVCTQCHKVRDEGDQWRSLQDYIALHFEAEFSAAVCPSCQAR